MKEEDGTLTLLRGEGRAIPSWNSEIIPHSVKEHKERLRCSACHAAWSFQDYGFHLMLEERPDYWKWSVNAAQNDPQVQSLLKRNVGTFVELIPPASGPIPHKEWDEWAPPTAKDWLSGEVRPGAWFRGYTARRWSNPPLGLDSRGRISVMRPMYQYVISHVDSEDNLLLDSHVPTTGGGKPALIFNPYEPHTTAKRGRSCHECHGDPKAAGLGEARRGIKNPRLQPVWRPEKGIPKRSFIWDALVDQDGKPLQFSSRPSAGPLDAPTLKRLMNPSKKHKALWSEFIHGRSSGKRGSPSQ
jgi:hypothetical protein